MLIDGEDGNGLSLMVNAENKLLVSENTTISSENIGSPPAGIYLIESEFDFITSANKDRKAPGGGRSWTRAADDAAICA